jgi:hypothetical protein
MSSRAFRPWPNCLKIAVRVAPCRPFHWQNAPSRKALSASLTRRNMLTGAMTN